MDDKEIGELFSLDLKKFKTKKELYSFLMWQLQSHMIEIDDRREGGDDHYKKEIADLAILARMLAFCEEVDENIFSERYKRFREKISENK